MSDAGTATHPHACPRCKQPLERGTLRESTVDACKSCKGTLLGQNDLIKTLESLSGPLLKGLDPDGKLEAAKDPSPRLDCPKCERRMERDDYCAAGVVLFDRCAGCAVLWFDADELGAMALMWARMNERRARDQAAARGAAGPTVIVIDRGFLGTSVWGLVVFGGMLLDSASNAVFRDDDVC